VTDINGNPVPPPCGPCGGGPVPPASIEALKNAPVIWQVKDANGQDIDGGAFQVYDEAVRFAGKFGYPRPVPVYQ
jgi:hypothetical protein